MRILATENLNWAWERIRLAIYICFGILSIRMALMFIEHAPISNPYLVSLLAAIIGIAAFIKTAWSLYAFILGLPLLIGFQSLGLIPHSNLLSALFGIIYLAWLFRRIVFERKPIAPKSQISNWIDLLAGLALISLIFRLWPLGKDVFLYHFWQFQVLSPNDILYSADASYIFCQGLIFFRLIEMQNDHLFSEKKKILPVIFFQAAIVFLFSLIQLVFKTPFREDYLRYGVIIYSPLEDVHSFGSYAVMIFALLLGANKALQPGRIRFYGNLLWVICAGLIILSYSRITWITAFLIFLWFITKKLSLNKKIIVGLVMAIALWGINAHLDDFSPKSSNRYLDRLQNVIILKDLPDYSRVVLWKRASGIIADYPITGSGIGTFYRLSTFYENSAEKYFKNRKENTHNYFLQLTAELGIPACFLFLLILFLVFRIGFTQDAKQNAVDQSYNRGLLMGISAYLMTCMTGHPLLLSSQQFLFWFVISAVVLDERNQENTYQVTKNSKFACAVTILLIGLIWGGYLFTDGKAEAGIERYTIGLYPYNQSKGDGFRWMSKIGITKVSHDGEFLEFDVSAMPFNIGPKGLNFKLSLNGDLWEEVNFTKPGTKKIRSFIPYANQRPLEIKTAVSRTFVPARHKINQDTRDLGVLMSEIKFTDNIPQDGFGFHSWEPRHWGPEATHGEPPPRFRWTGMNASMIVDESAGSRMKVLLMTLHPDISKEHVRVQMWGDRKIIGEEIFTDHQWREISFPPEALKDVGVLTFRVSRTWNPKISGVSEDDRDLGVAVSVILD